jgi:hypothetical protein
LHERVRMTGVEKRKEKKGKERKENERKERRKGNA